MRPWYDDIDTATLQRIKTYSAFNDPESKNLMVQTMYEYKQEEIVELEKRCANYEMTISKMEKGTCDICKETEKDKKIEALEQQIEKMKCCGNCVWSDCDGKLGNPPCKYCDFNNKWELRR
jgi:hypothetical protein